MQECITLINFLVYAIPELIDKKNKRNNNIRKRLQQIQNLEVSKNIQQIRIEDMYKRQIIKFSDELSKEKVKELKEEIFEDKKIQKYGGEFSYKGKRTIFLSEEEKKEIKKEIQKTR